MVYQAEREPALEAERAAKQAEIAVSGRRHAARVLEIFGRMKQRDIFLYRHDFQDEHGKHDEA